jgi:hypothetical protein
MTLAQHEDLGALGSLTAGSVVFAGTNGVLDQDNAKLFWNNSTKRLGVGTASPTVKFQVGDNSDQSAAKIFSGGANKAPVLSLFHTGSSEGVIVQTTGGLAFASTGGLANYNDTTLAAMGGMRLDTSNRLIVGGTNANNCRTFIDGTTDEVKLGVRASASQTKNLQEWQSNAGGAIAYVSAAGNFRANGLSFGRRTIANDDQGTLASDYLLLAYATASGFTLALPVALSNDGRCLVIKRCDANPHFTITIDGDGSETIDGALTIALTAQYQCVTLICDGFNWWVV